jgi:hypothetical protein
VCACAMLRYAGGSVVTDRASHAGHVKRKIPDKEGDLDPPDCTEGWYVTT